MSLALHYWMGDAHHCSGPPVSEMTYTVSSGTLNPTIPYLAGTYEPFNEGVNDVRFGWRQRTCVTYMLFRHWLVNTRSSCYLQPISTDSFSCCLSAIVYRCLKDSSGLFRCHLETAFSFHSRPMFTYFMYAGWNSWGTGIRGLMRGMANLPERNQQLLVVKDKVGRPPVNLG